METIYELWAKRNPEFEKRYQDTVLSVFTDYGKGVSQFNDIRGKIFGAGYEVYIIAFFIGLYHNQTKPLVEDASKRKVLGQPIMYWGNIEERTGRKAYGKIREYIFAALVARTDIDWIALDKEEITAQSVVKTLIDKMEEYHSHNTHRLDVEGMKALLHKLTFIREDLGLQPRSKAKEIRSE